MTDVIDGARTVAESILARVRALNAELRAVGERTEALWEERRRLYVEARRTTPPVHYAALADAAGTTEAAVMQVVNKAHVAELIDAATARIGPLTSWQRKHLVTRLARRGGPDKQRAALDRMSDDDLRILLKVPARPKPPARSL